MNKVCDKLTRNMYISPLLGIDFSPHPVASVRAFHLSFFDGIRRRNINPLFGENYLILYFIESRSRSTERGSPCAMGRNNFDTQAYLRNLSLFLELQTLRVSEYMYMFKLY